MSNFFTFDSSYQYEPVIKPIDPKLVEKEIEAFRSKIVKNIRLVVDQKDMSRSELVLTARISRPTAGMIIRGDSDKISTDRLLRVARRLGLKPKVKFVSDPTTEGNTAA